MVYEVKKTIKPSDVYGADAKDKIARLIKREYYYVTSFRPPESGDHFVTNDGTEIMGCCATKSFDPRIIVVPLNEPMATIWE